MNVVFTNGYTANSQICCYRTAEKKPAFKKECSQALADSRHSLEMPVQSAGTGKRQNALMEVYEKMQSTGAKGKGLKTENSLKLIRNAKEGSYASAADENGVIEYNGVLFTANEKGICLGDVSNSDQVICIPLSTGESLMVNRNCIGDLSRAVGMFSPEDQNRILRALQIDAKIQEVKAEIEKMGDDAGAGGGQEETGYV